MKCYNSFGEMFRAQGGDRSVFNGIAQTKVSWEDSVGNESDPVYFRFSTNDPKSNVTVAWSKDGKKYALMGSAPQEVRDAMKNTKLLKVVKELNDKIDGKKKKNPKYDPSTISTEKLVGWLNSRCSNIGVDAFWTDKNTDTPTKKEKGEADKKDINVIKATGIFVSDLGNISFAKFGYEHGKPYAIAYDEHGMEKEHISPEKIVGKDYVVAATKDPETYSKTLDDRVAEYIEFRYKEQGGLKLDNVLWKGGDVKFNDLYREFKSTLSARKSNKRLDEQLIEKRKKELKDKAWKDKSLLGKVAYSIGQALF